MEAKAAAGKAGNEVDTDQNQKEEEMRMKKATDEVEKMLKIAEGLNHLNIDERDLLVKFLRRPDKGEAVDQDKVDL